MSPDAECPQPVHEADRRVDVGAWDLVVHGARSGLVPAEVHAVEVEVVLEEELVDECGQLWPLGQGLDDCELNAHGVDVDLDRDEVVGHRSRLEDAQERVRRVIRRWQLALIHHIVVETHPGALVGGELAPPVPLLAPPPSCVARRRLPRENRIRLEAAVRVDAVEQR